MRIAGMDRALRQLLAAAWLGLAVAMVRNRVSQAGGMSQERLGRRGVSLEAELGAGAVLAGRPVGGRLCWVGVRSGGGGEAWFRYPVRQVARHGQTPRLPPPH